MNNKRRVQRYNVPLRGGCGRTGSTVKEAFCIQTTTRTFAGSTCRKANIAHFWENSYPQLQGDDDVQRCSVRRARALWAEPLDLDRTDG